MGKENVVSKEESVMTTIRLIRDSINSLILSENMYNSDLLLYWKQWDTTAQTLFLCRQEHPPHQQCTPVAFPNVSHFSPLAYLDSDTNN